MDATTLLTRAVEEGASDLFLSVNAPPLVDNTFVPVEAIRQ